MKETKPGEPGGTWGMGWTRETGRTSGVRGTRGKGLIDFVQTKFIRWLLGVNKFCSSNAHRSEVGQFPM